MRLASFQINEQVVESLTLRLALGLAYGGTIGSSEC